MDDISRITRWVNTILEEASKLDDDQGLELLHACGRDCSKAGTLIKGAADIRNKHADTEDTEVLLKAFKDQYYNSSELSMKDGKISLIFKQCTCPLVKLGVDNSYLCNCTKGYSMQIFETLFGRPVKLTLKSSILKGDKICEQEILVK